MALLPFDFVHAINGLKNWPMVEVLDFLSKMDATDAAYAVASRCVHLDATSGLYKLGCVGLQMPLFLSRSPVSLDVANDGGTFWTAGFPKGNLGCLVATGAFELDVTEFDGTVTYAPNDPLKSPSTAQITPGAGQANAGMLYKTKNWAGGGGGALTPYTDTIVGLVSRGTRVNNNRVSVLSFWPNPVYGTA